VTTAIVDYGMGNLDSVARAVEECGGSPMVTSDPHDLARAAAIILPGVGAFAEGMRNIRERGLDQALHEQVDENEVPLLGLCLGMQLLATAGHEGDDVAGLGWIEAEIERLEPTEEGERIPHVGWNEVYPARTTKLFAGVDPGKDFYFVHSYHMVCRHSDDIVATTPYCGSFASAVGRDCVWGVQFHPEKSRRSGFQLLTNFLALERRR
jgi:imidazole glycerol-phosphate synthase subunit HisH